MQVQCCDCHSLYSSPTAAGLGRGFAQKTYEQVDLRWGSYSTGATLPSQIRDQSPVAHWNIITGNFHTCSGWPGLLWHSNNMPYELQSALLGSPSWPLNLLLISSHNLLNPDFAWWDEQSLTYQRLSPNQQSGWKGLCPLTSLLLVIQKQNII